MNRTQDVNWRMRSYTLQKTHCKAAWASATFLTLWPAFLLANSLTIDKLADLSLEELLEVRISSVSQLANQALGRASAKYVISREAIQQSGRRTIPELLRMAPGVHVARVTSNKWAVGLRGLNSRTASKVLVLLDGRALYSRSMPGVLWDHIDTIIDDIERIEVIRGPGASLWGSNAVNGVINIVTRSSELTRGGVLDVHGGNQVDSDIAARFGWQLSDHTHARVYAKHLEHAEYRDPAGEGQHDEWRRSLIGFRMDSRTQSDSWRLSAEWSETHPDEILHSIDFVELQQRAMITSNRVGSANIMTQWTRQFSPDNQLSLRFYVDHENRDSNILRLHRNSYDLDLKQKLKFGHRHNLVWGLGYRESHDDMQDTDILLAGTNNITVRVAQGFVQDEMQLTDGLTALLGIKLEDSSFSDLEIQPSLKLSWQASTRQQYWASVAKAVRTPNRAGTQLVMNIPSLLLPPGTNSNPLPRPMVAQLVGNAELDSEQLIAYELGYRLDHSKTWQFDAALFHNDYARLNGTEFTGITCAPGGELLAISPACLLNSTHVVAPLTMNNEVHGHTRGGELAARWQLSRELSADINVSWVDYSLHSASPGYLNEVAELQNPGRLANLRISYHPSIALSGNLWLRYAGDIAGVPELGQHIPSYTALDLRAQWRPTPELTLSIDGINLNAADHLEFGEGIGDVRNLPVPRSIHFGLQLVF